MSPWRLMVRSTMDLAWAILLGSALLVPFLVAAAFHPTHIDSFTFKKLPPDDQALGRWVQAQPQGVAAEIHRSASAIELRYLGEQLSPPWETLGYKEIGGAHLQTSLITFNDPKVMLEMILCLQAGLFAISLWRLGRARRDGEPVPPLFAGKGTTAVLWGLGIGVTMVGFGLLYEFILRQLPGSAASGASIWSATRQFPRWGQMLVLLGGAVAAPIAEETFFRGAAFGSFCAAGRPALGAGFTSLLFASAHLDLVNAVAYVAFGLVLAWVYRRSRSILAPITAHLLNNSVAFILIFTGHG